MDHDIVPCSSKICDWPIVPGPLQFPSRNKCKGDHETWGPKRPIFRPTLSTIMVQWVLQWERQKRSSRCKCQRTMVEECRFDILNLFFLPNVSIVTIFRKKEEEGEKFKHEDNSQTTIFGHISKKLAHPFFFGAWSFLLVHIWFTPSQGPKGFKNAIIQIRTMEVWSWSVTMEKCPLTWDNFMVHDINNPLLPFSRNTNPCPL